MLTSVREGRRIVRFHHHRSMSLFEAMRRWEAGEEVLLTSGAKVVRLPEGGALLKGYSWDGRDIAAVLK